MEMTDAEITKFLLATKQSLGLKWGDIGNFVGHAPVYIASVFYLQNVINESEFDKLCTVLKFGQLELESSKLFSIKNALIDTKPQLKGQGNWDVLKQDPVLNRLHEINVVYGLAIKELIYEKMGNGIMSAVDFDVEVDKVEDSKGDRIKITLTGKCLPFKRF